MTPFWRRERPLHERLADEGGIAMPIESTRDVAPWHQAGVHGVARPRRWDAVVTTEADVPGDEARFVVLGDGTLLAEDGPPEALEPLAAAVGTQVRPPYRAEATRRGERLWAVGATRIRTARLDEQIGGGTVELAVQDGERTVLVDGALAIGSFASLEALAGGLPSYVIRADRLHGDVWEISVAPL